MSDPVPSSRPVAPATRPDAPAQVPPVQVPPVQRKSPRRAVDLRFRYLYKPITFCAALVPFAGCVGGVLALYGLPFVRGFNLGVDPQRYVLDIFGKTSLNLLLITLAVSPARQLTHWGICCGCAACSACSRSSMR